MLEHIKEFFNKVSNEIIDENDDVVSMSDSLNIINTSANNNIQS